MIFAPPLRKITQAATEGTEPDSPLLSLLTDLLFADKTLRFWRSLQRPMGDLIDEQLLSRQLERLTPPLTAIGYHLRGAGDLSETALTARLLSVLEILKANHHHFFLPRATPDERLMRLPLFTPMAVLHLSILSLLHRLALTNCIPAAAYFRFLCNTTADRYFDYAQKSVSDAVAWRTGQLDITCTPMRSAAFGGPNLQITCVDTHTGQTIVDEICAAYPGIRNPLLQHTVDRVNLYKDQLYYRSALFWGSQVLDVLAEWNEGEKDMAMPVPPDTMNAKLDDALYLIMQDIGKAMLGLK